MGGVPDRRKQYHGTSFSLTQSHQNYPFRNPKDTFPIVKSWLCIARLMQI